MPRRFQRGRILKWLKRTHAWMALWGGIAGTLFGLTGILLNHRDIMKIPAVQSHAETLQISVAEAPPQSADELAQMLKGQLKIEGPGAPRIVRQPSKLAPWGDGSIVQPERWEVSFSSPQRFVSAEYWVGNRSVSVQDRSGNAFYWLTRLHKGVGVHVGWILAADAMAGMLLFMTITGVLLWSKLHGPRLLAISLFGGSLGLLAWFAVLS